MNVNSQEHFQHLYVSRSVEMESKQTLIHVMMTT